MRIGVTAALLPVLLPVLLLTGCSDDDGTGAAAPTSRPTSSISTLSPLPMPDMGPPPGEIVADLRQSSRDAALNRFEVWIGNGLDRPITPTRVLYRDPRLLAPIPGERLREDPSGSERGYPLALPDRPDCTAPNTERNRGSISLTYDGRTVTLPVEDEADVVARFVAGRCFELASERVAALSFDDRVPDDGTGEGAVGTLTLVVTPSGDTGTGRLTVASVTGTPVLTAYPRGTWRPRVTVTGTDDVQRIELPVIPARCDGHAFGESGGATAFRVRLRLDGRPGELLVRMSPAGAANAIGFARRSCGL